MAGEELWSPVRAPLLILASFREDVLHEGSAHPLWAAIGAQEPQAAAVTVGALEAALAPERTRFWQNLRRRFVQTNEPSRGVAWLWPAAMWEAIAPGRPVKLIELGASAGLNLVADHLSPMWTAAGGQALATAPLPRIGLRKGFDLRPLDARNEDDARWLLACLWPGQAERADRLAEAIRVYRSLCDAGERIEMDTATATSIPPLLPDPGHRGHVLAFQSILRDYLSAEERTAYEEGMRRWLRRSPRGSALWLELEISAETTGDGPPTALTAHLRGPHDEVQTVPLARGEPHPQVIHVDARGGYREFRRLLAV